MISVPSQPVRYVLVTTLSMQRKHVGVETGTSYRTVCREWEAFNQHQIDRLMIAADQIPPRIRALPECRSCAKVLNSMTITRQMTWEDL